LTTLERGITFTFSWLLFLIETPEDKKLNEEFPTISFEDKYEDEARVNVDLRKALDLLKAADEAHKKEDIDKAIELYKNSIAYCPTADAHTYLGWMYSIQDRMHEAIEECHQAIEIDPDFGNPYNDIGCYLMQMEEFEEAVSWLEKAKQAPRYHPRHFPYMNLSRILLRQGKHGKAVGELYEATRRAPEDKALRQQLVELISLLN
jgi:Tfp pilus assembly protein PilF